MEIGTGVLFGDKYLVKTSQGWADGDGKIWRVQRVKRKGVWVGWLSTCEGEEPIRVPIIHIFPFILGSYNRERDRIVKLVDGGPS